MTAILLNSLLPIFVVMALGYFAGHVRDIDNQHVGELNALVMDFALPASLFVATAGLILLLPMQKDTARAAILLTALPSGFFGVLFGLRYGVRSHEAGSTLIVSTILSALTLAAALILTAAS
jgi:predicted permease